MLCSRCGTPIPSDAGACPACVALDPATVATGVLTPPPTCADADAETGVGIAPASAAAQSGPLAAGQTFGSRYHIIRPLGIGGMGAVYQAWDTELGVAVAIKVIRPDVMADPGAAAEIERRFKRELLLARQVTHKNVVRIHDLGQIDGIKYITMSYVEGHDLATLLKQDGPWPIPRVLRVARDIVAGLLQAHKAGVVHRDLKPANIMIDASGDALIMDFGIARSADAGAAEAAAAAGTIQMLPATIRETAMAAAATRYGAIVGTVEYMAPEQARGLDVDQRADIYALGLILYDMVAGRGRRALHDESAIAELRARMDQAPPPVRSLVPTVPEALDALISRCLEPDPAKRYATTEELAAALARLDEDGVPLPAPRRFTPTLIGAAVLLVAALVGGTWWLTRTPPLEKPHDPVSVVIADFQNGTGDPSFDRALAQTVRRGLEDASFISAFDRSRINRATLGVQPPSTLDFAAAREIAVKQGVGVVLAGSIQPRGNGYDIALTASQTVTGAVISTASARAGGKSDVLPTATRLTSSVRKALGDRTSQTAQLFAMRSISTSSLDVVTFYAAAVEAQARSKMEDARQNYLKAVALDPNFGLGYQGLAVVSRNLGRVDDADRYIKEALRHLDGMTDRERLATRGYYDRVIGDNAQCVKEYGELLARYPADAIAHNQRAGCFQKLRNMRDAAAEMRQAVQMLPNHVGFRTNLALLADLSGDFDAAEQDVNRIAQPDARALQALAYSQAARGIVPAATATYQKIAAMGAGGASAAASGLADLAFYEGRYSEAIQTLEPAAAADLAANNPDRAAIKLTSIAYAHLMAGRKAPAIAAADKAVATSSAMAVRFLAGRIFAEAGAVEKARPIAAALSSELAAEPHAHGRILEGLIALRAGDARGAVQTLTDANAVVDTWIGHFDLGRAYLQAGAAALPQADSEFDLCISRRGEALSLMDEGPTYGYFPPVYYYQARVREGLGTSGFADLYRRYLDIRRRSTEDLLAPDASARAGR